MLDNRSTLVADRTHERYLRLLAFIIHQYMSVGDALILTAPADRLEASDCIVARSNALPLTDLLRRQENFIHTGSDGQKYDVSAPSLRAAASFKYHGNGEGMTVYSGLDEAGQLIYSTVFNSAGRWSTTSGSSVMSKLRN